MKHVVIPAAQIEFHEGGNTLWVHSPDGVTTLRLKFTGGIKVVSCGDGNHSHSDLIVNDELTVCLGVDAGVDA